MFPEGVTYNFQNNTYRTCRSNSVFASIAGQSRLLENEETGIHTCYSKNSGLVAPRVEKSNQILQDLRELAILMDNT